MCAFSISRFRLLHRESGGVRAGDLLMSFKSIFQDVRSAMDHVHIHGDLQNATVAVSVQHHSSAKSIFKQFKCSVFLFSAEFG